MASVYDYTFHQNTRIGDDSCDLSQENVQNAHAATYMLDNFRPACPMKNAIDFATSQPAINFKGSHQVGINGCNIDNNSKLGITPITKPKCRISLQSRPFLTVPYLGKGPGDCEIETKMLHSNQDNHKKSVQCSSEKSYIPYFHYPLLEPIKQKITNPKHLVEEDASSGWIRGGISTRDLTRQKNFAEQHNKYQYS